jgi:hypothetical protein
VGSSPPLAIKLAAVAATSGAQQLQISALHQIETHSHEADRAISQIMGFPGWAGWDVRCAKQCLGNLSICRTGKVPIERPQRERKSSTLGLREMIGRTAPWPTACKSPKASRSLGSCGEISVERNDDRRGRIGPRGIDEDCCQPVIAMIDEPIFAFDCGAPDCWFQPADAARFSEYLRCRCNNDRRGIEARQPDEPYPVAM